MLSKNLVKYRKQSKMTQKQVAERLHISPQAYARYERTDEKKSEPSAENLKLLAEIFNVSVDDLIGKENTEINPEVLMFKVEGLGDISDEEKQRIEQTLIEQALFMIERSKKNK